MKKDKLSIIANKKTKSIIEKTIQESFVAVLLYR